MKLNSIGYLVKEGIKNTFVNRLMTIASVGVLVACMVIMGIAVMLSANVNKAMSGLEKQNVVYAYFKDKTWAEYEGTDKKDYPIKNEEDAKALCEEIKKIEKVVSVDYISSEKGLESAIEAIPEGDRKFFKFLESENPLSGAARISMEDMKSVEDYEAVVKKVSELEGVSAIQSNTGLADTISTIKNGVTVAGVWLIGLLLVISFVIVSNTIRVTMYSRRLEISIMKAVGATDTFVRIPFMVEGMVIGVISAIIAEVLLYFFYRIATEDITSIFGQDIVKMSEMSATLTVIFLIIGILSGIIGSVGIINKYLRKEGSEFAAL
jgi:cell division transport system permease protein